jgi:hypothetical protein
MRKRFAVLICIFLLAMIISCGGSSGGDGGGGNNSPVVQITSPAEGSIFTVGEVIQFAGSCNDNEDGDLSGGSLVWTSDVDGQIDTGETCSSTTLSVGAHQITLTGTDAEGAEGMDTVAITINAAPASGSLPDTGQTTSYTDTFGEDSDYSINPPAYTKLDASGSALNAGAADWTMVRDDVTRLVWEVKTDDDTIHDRDNTYTWQNAQDVLIAQLNSDNFGGYSDWRLPTIKELSSLVHADVFSPAINTAYFPQSMSSVYWSSTTCAFNTDDAWYVNFSTGYVYCCSKTNSPFNYVRAVRGGQ